MARARPASSWSAACHHLFRHLGDARELRRNPIAAPFFHGAADCGIHADKLALAAIRNAILMALSEYELDALASGRVEECRRRRAIVESHILSGQPAESVAKEIHLSRAQFYRERREICDYLASAISTVRDSPHSPASGPLNPDAIAIARANLLVEACEPQRALDVLEDVARSSPDPIRKVEALCLAACIHSSQVQYERAESQLDVARRFQSESDLSRLRVDFTAALLASGAGRTDEAKRMTQKVLSALSHASQQNEELRELHVDALSFAAERARSSGNQSDYRKHLAAAQLLFDAGSNQSLRQKARLFILSALLCEDRDAHVTFDECARMQTAARDFAQRGGLILTAIDAALDLSGVYAFGLGKGDSALREALPILSFALKTRNPVLIGSVCIQITELYVANRKFNEAASVLEISNRLGRYDPFHEASLRCVAAEVYFGLRDFGRASAYADNAGKLAARIKNKRLHSGALRIAALAYFRDNQRAVASARVEEALSLSDTSGPRTATALTYYASSLITGNRDHARIARSLNANALSMLA